MRKAGWLKADNLTKIANIILGKPFKFLIPQEFGGGFLKDYYQGYGRLGTTTKYDMFELLAFWNGDMITTKRICYYNQGMDGYINYPAGIRIKDVLIYEGEFNPMKECDKYTYYNRMIGISIGNHKVQMDLLKYPLKLVSASYRGTYKECEGRSYRDHSYEPKIIYRKDVK